MSGAIAALGALAAAPERAAGAGSRVRRLWHLARADFLERSRQASFVVAMILNAWAAQIFLPPNGSNYSTLMLGAHRGVYGAWWVGSLIAMLSSLFMGLIGFYLAKNAVERDRRTGVGQILAGTPLTKLEYALGKLASNCALLWALTLTTALTAPFLQLWIGEDRAIRPEGYLLPYALVTMPAMAVTAAFAVLFEMAPALRGGLGNVVWFFSWVGLVSASGVAESRYDPMSDATGTSLLLPQMAEACSRAFPDFLPGSKDISMGINISSKGHWTLSTFRWDGPVFGERAVLSRFAWLAIALALTALGALLFDRFTHVAAKAPGRRAATRDGKAGLLPGEERQTDPPEGALSSRRLSAAKPGPAFGGLVRAELALLLRRRSRWWWLVLAGLGVGSVLAPVEVGRRMLASAAWIWPMFLWSPLGARESLCGTGGLLFSSPRPVARQLAAAWLAGAAVALLVGGPMAIRFVLAARPDAALAVLSGAAFIPALALACGIWSRGTRLFEVLFLVLWYCGLLNGVPPLDFAGATDEALRLGMPALFLALAAGLGAVAVADRRRQVLGSAG